MPVIKIYDVFMNNSEKKIYSGDIVAGSLLMEESRKVAALLIDNVDSQGWYKAIVLENTLQKRGPATARRQSHLIKARLSLMTRDLWQLIVKGSSETTSHALLAASIKQSRLVGDFMDTVLRQHWLTFTQKITVTDWSNYLEQCAQIDPHVKRWKESTRSKLRQVVFRMLAQARYIDSTRSCRLIPVSLSPEVRGYLVKNNETYVLQCMEIS